MTDIEFLTHNTDSRAEFKPVITNTAKLERTAVQRFIVLVKFAAIIFASLYLLALVLTPYDPNNADFLSRLQAPNLNHWFGTDEL